MAVQQHLHFIAALHPVSRRGATRQEICDRPAAHPRQQRCLQLILCQTVQIPALCSAGFQCPAGLQQKLTQRDEQRLTFRPGKPAGRCVEQDQSVAVGAQMHRIDTPATPGRCAAGIG